MCQVYTIRSSSLIFSFYKLNPEILGRVVEEKEEIANIEHLLRDKLLNKISNATVDSGETAEVCFVTMNSPFWIFKICYVCKIDGIPTLVQ